ncbi:hypothetical protein V6N13_083562 [Hibiscus sabdariffa]
MARRRHNNVRRLKIGNGEWCEEPMALKEAIVEYFQQLFSSEPRVQNLNAPYGNFHSFIVSELHSTLVEVSPDKVRQNQASFVSGRFIQDNIIIAYEVIHSMSCKSGRKSWMAIKVNLEKAYDRLEWDFIEETLGDVGLPNRFINLIMHCVRSVSTQVLWNGEVSSTFRPSQGIHQSDPLSPYLFVLCMEKLGQTIEAHVDNAKKDISGILYRYGFMRTDTSEGFRLLEIPETKRRTNTGNRTGTSLGVPIRYKRTDTVTRVPKPYAPEVQIWLLKATQRLQNIPNGRQQLVGPDVYAKVSSCESANEVWDKLEVIHEGTNDVKETKIGLLNLEYKNFKMDPNEDIKSMFDRFSTIVNQLKGFGEEIPEDKLIRKLIYSLPQSWDSKKTAIIEAKDLKKLKLDELIGSLLTHEMMYIPLKREKEKII